MEASAKTKEGINVVFDEVVQKILENPTLLSNTRPQVNKSPIIIPYCLLSTCHLCASEIPFEGQHQCCQLQDIR